MHEFPLGTHLKVFSELDVAPGDRRAGDGSPAYLLLICHGVFFGGKGYGFGTLDLPATGHTTAPLTCSLRFSVPHGDTADTDALYYFVKEAARMGLSESTVNRCYPHVPGAEGPINYHLGKGYPMPNQVSIASWFRGAKPDAGAEPSAGWVNSAFVRRIRSPGVDVARVRTSCHTLADVITSLDQSPHRYETVLCHFCREDPIADMVN